MCGSKRETWESHFHHGVLQNGLISSVLLYSQNHLKGLQFSILNLGFSNYQVSNFRLFLNFRRYTFIQVWENIENGIFFETGFEVVQAEPDFGSAHIHSPLQC